MRKGKSEMANQGRPKKKPEEKLRGYRYNLNLDRDLKDYLEDAAWKRRTSITQYINDLIREDAKKQRLNQIENIIDDYDISSAIISICIDKKIKLEHSELQKIVDFMIARKRGIKNVSK